MQAICVLCDEPIEDDEALVQLDEGPAHMPCAIEDQDCNDPWAHDSDKDY